MGHLHVAQCWGGTTFSGSESGMLDMLPGDNSSHNEQLSCVSLGCSAWLQHALKLPELNCGENQGKPVLCFVGTLVEVSHHVKN